MNDKKRKKRIITIIMVIIIIIILLLLKRCSNKKETEISTPSANSNDVKEIVVDSSSKTEEATEQVEKQNDVNVEDQKEEKEIDSTALSYWVNFLNKDGSVLQRTSWKYGTTPTFNGDTPTYFDGSFYYAFSGWDKEIAKVYGTQTYMAKYDITGFVPRNTSSTSSLVEECQHKDAYHIYISSYNPNGNDVYSWYIYDAITEKLFYYGDYNDDDADEWIKNSPGEGWFYSTDNINYYPCNDNCQHSTTTYSELDHDNYNHYVARDDGNIYKLLDNTYGIWSESDLEGSNISLDVADPVSVGNEDQNKPTSANGYWSKVYVKINGWYYACNERHYGVWY